MFLSLLAGFLQFDLIWTYFSRCLCVVVYAS